MRSPEVRWIDVDTGEVKCRHYTGRDPVIWSAASPHNPTGEPWFNGEYYEWEMTALEMALQLVPDLEAIMDRARREGYSVEVRVKTEPAFDEPAPSTAGSGTAERAPSEA